MRVSLDVSSVTNRPGRRHGRPAPGVEARALPVALDISSVTNRRFVAWSAFR
jgi:hypothetical protein